MSTTTSANLPRCASVWLSVTLTAGALLWWLAPTLRDPDPTSFDNGLVWSCAVVAALASGWLWTVTSVVAAATVTGRAHAVRGVPAPVRRLLLVACGVALIGGLAAPAVATPGQPVSLSGLPMPDRAASALPGGAVLQTGRVHHPVARASAREVVVARGDSLWTIASRDLGSGATDAEISRRWQQIYDLNRAAIGSDPDLVQPALRLRMPAG